MKNYCHLCGAKYLQGISQPWQCSGCGNLSYLVSSPTVEIALFDQQGRVLLAERGIEPNKGKLDLPGGFLILDEHVEDGLAREIEEELGLKPEDYSKPQYSTSWTGHNYNFSKENLHTLNLVFGAKIVSDKKLQALDDVASTKFCSMGDLDKIQFSFPLYPDIIRKAHKLIFQNK